MEIEPKPKNTKRTLNEMDPTNVETQNLGVSIISNTPEQIVFGTLDSAKLIASSLNSKSLFSLGMVNVFFRAIYKNELIVNLNNGKYTLQDLKIQSLQKFIEFLKEDSSKLKNLNLNGTLILIDELIVKKIVNSFPGLNSLSIAGCKIYEPEFYFPELVKLPLKNLNLSGCKQGYKFPYVRNLDPIKSLNLIEDFTSLVSLNISHWSSISDYSILNKFTDLQILNLESNRPNLSFLEKCTRLRDLNLKDCYGENILPFIKFFKEGRITQVNGSILEGKLVNGIPEGQHLAINSQGIKEYEGNVIKGIANGHGTTFYENGNKESEGNFVDGEMVGQGIKFDPEGNKCYEGNILNGHPSGIGVMYYEDGEILEGDFYSEDDDVFCDGKSITLSGDVLEGVFKV